MKYIPLTEKNLKLYIAIGVLWLALGLIEWPCSSKNMPVFEIWLVSFVSLLFVLAWSISRRLGIEPSSAKNIGILVIKSAYETFFLILLFIVFSLPLIILTPVYQCYTDRAYNTEIIAIASEARAEITKIITSNNKVMNDYSSVKIPEHKRIDHYQVTAEGIILIHSKNPDFTAYLTPSMQNSEVVWKCKSYPVEKSPHECR